MRAHRVEQGQQGSRFAHRVELLGHFKRNPFPHAIRRRGHDLRQFSRMVAVLKPEIAIGELS